MGLMVNCRLDTLRNKVVMSFNFRSRVNPE